VFEFSNENEFERARLTIGCVNLLVELERLVPGGNVAWRVFRYVDSCEMPAHGRSKTRSEAIRAAEDAIYRMMPTQAPTCDDFPSYRGREACDYSRKIPALA
jgi:hypothetical protein